MFGRHKQLDIAFYNKLPFYFYPTGSKKAAEIFVRPQ